MLFAWQTLKQLLAALSVNGSGTRCFYFPVREEKKRSFQQQPSEGTFLKAPATIKFKSKCNNLEELESQQDETPKCPL